MPCWIFWSGRNQKSMLFGKRQFPVWQQSWTPAAMKEYIFITASTATLPRDTWVLVLRFFLVRPASLYRCFSKFHNGEKPLFLLSYKHTRIAVSQYIQALTNGLQNPSWICLIWIYTFIFVCRWVNHIFGISQLLEKVHTVLLKFSYCAEKNYNVKPPVLCSILLFETDFFQEIILKNRMFSAVWPGSKEKIVLGWQKRCVYKSSSTTRLNYSSLFHFAHPFCMKSNAITK